MILRSRSPRRLPSRFPAFALTLVAATLGACGGGGSDADATTDGDGAATDTSGGVVGTDGTDGIGGGGSVVDQIGTDGGGTDVMTGDILRHGVVTVGDANGGASDAVAGFFTLSAGVSERAFGGALDPDVAECRVVPAGGDVGFENASAGFLPSPASVDAVSIDVGETLTLTSAGSTWVELQPMSIGGVRLYDVATGSVLPDGPVPEDLSVDVPGGVFPAFAGAALPDVEPLVGFDDGEGDTIGTGTRFTWQPGGEAGSKIRLAYVTNAGFFADDGGVTLSCTVPDTGSFAFSRETRAALGEDFEGAASVVSRVAIDTLRQDDALLILVRESEAGG